ncbi:chitin deacetylase cda1 [Dionaea muscipula]
MAPFNFAIDASDAESLAKSHGLTVLQLLPIIVKSARELARPPISNFPVAAAGLTSDGRIFIGVNLEFPGLPLHHSVHAEQFLVTNLSLHRPTPLLQNIVVSAYPCGHCRQFLQEIRGAPDIQIFVPEDDDDLGVVREGDSFRPVSYFLPNRFGPDDLLHKDVPLILESHDNCLVLSDGEKANLRNGFSLSGELVLAALEAANKSHAPYSRCPSGVALMDADGRIYKGSYMESAAYNPSLGPAQAAAVAYVAAVGGAGYDRIVAAVLVEKEEAVVRQDVTVRLFLKAISPKCEFHVVHCHTSSK